MPFDVVKHFSSPLKPKASGALYMGRGGGRKSILLEGTQAMPARPSDKDRMRMKTLGSWVIKARDRDVGLLF
jgi:hypothetical protein